MKRQKFLSKAKGRSLVGWGLRPYEYPGATSTSLDSALRRSCARPTGGTHGRTTGTPILLISIRFPLENKEAGAPASPAWGLRRTAVGRAPRATSTPPRAAPPRLA